jgi:CubicO group peptidase (beta-lactamase class C family)
LANLGIGPKGEKMLYRAIIFLIFSFFVFPEQNIKSDFIVDDQFDKKIEQMMNYWQIPGVAIGIIHKDQILKKCYGVRSIDLPDRIDQNTVFGIASLSKTFLAALIAQCVEQGLLDWNDTISKHLPDFQVQDTYATRHLTIKDILSHRAGFERADFVWVLGDYTQEQLMDQLRALKIKNSFRSCSIYNNLLWLFLVKILQKVTGLSWSELLQKDILTPLEMNTTYPDNKALVSIENKASTHAIINGTAAVHERLNWDHMPCASMNSSLDDMLKWLQFSMSYDPYFKILKPETLQELHRAHGLDCEDALPNSSFASWGLGWVTCIYKGKRIVYMEGAGGGIASSIVFIPEDQFGFVFLTNANMSTYDGMNMTILDHYLGGNIDWYQYCVDKDTQESVHDFHQPNIKNTVPTLQLEEYAGVYENDLYGIFEVRLINGQLVVQSPTLKGDLRHWQNDTFLMSISPYFYQKPFFMFQINPLGNVEALLIEPYAYWNDIQEKIWCTKK